VSRRLARPYYRRVRTELAPIFTLQLHLLHQLQLPGRRYEYLRPSLRNTHVSSTAMAVVGGRILVKGDWYQTLSKHHSHNLTARSAHLVLGTPNVEFFFSVDYSTRGLARRKPVSRRMIQQQGPLDAPRRARQLFLRCIVLTRVRVGAVSLGMLDLELVWKSIDHSTRGLEGSNARRRRLLIVTQPWDVTPNYALTAWHACCEIVLYNRSNLINPRKSTGPRALRSHSSNGYRDVKFYTPRRGDYKSRTYPNAARFCESWVDTGDSTGDALCM
jgi:hypothetical protein